MAASKATAVTKKGIRSPPAKKAQSPGSRRPGKATADKREVKRAPEAKAKKSTTRTRSSAAAKVSKASKAKAATTSAAKASKAKSVTTSAAKAAASGTARVTSRELASKIKEITESNAELRDEIRSIAKTFTGNQKRMSSISGMSGSLEAVLVQIQKQSRQISGLKKETQGLFDELEEISAQHAAIGNLEEQVRSMQQQLVKAADSIRAESASDAKISKKIGDGLKSIRDSSESIVRLSEAVDAVRMEIRKVAARSASAAGTGAEIDALRSEIAKISDVTQPGSMIGTLRGDLERMAGRFDEFSKRQEELESGQRDGPNGFDPNRILDSIAAGSSRIEQMGAALDAFREQLGQISSKAAEAESAGMESSKLITERLRSISDELRSIVQEEMASTMAARAEGAGGGDDGRDEFKSIRDGIASLKSDTAGSMREMGQWIARISEEIRGQESDTARMYEKMQEVYAEMRRVKESADTHKRAASDHTARMIKLSEYQSMIRMNAESKYGDLGTISHMAQRTAEIAALFEGGGPGGSSQTVSKGADLDDGHGDQIPASDSEHTAASASDVEPAEGAGDHDGVRNGDAVTERSTPLPLDVKRWAVGKMFDCADRWEIRFSDAYGVIKDAIGPGMLAESLRMQQIRDIYGIRAVKSTREDLGIDD